MSTSLHDLQRRLEVLERGVQRVPVEMVQAAAAIVESSINREIGQDAPHHTVAGGIPGVKHKTITSGDHPAVLLTGKGTLHLLSNPTKAHPIAHRRVQALRTPYGPRARVSHPGTPGKHTWPHGVDKARPLVIEGAHEAVVNVVRGIFR